MRIFAAISYYLCCLIFITQKQKEQNQGEKTNQRANTRNRSTPKTKRLKICPVFLILSHTFIFYRLIVFRLNLPRFRAFKWHCVLLDTEKPNTKQGKPNQRPPPKVDKTPTKYAYSTRRR